MGETVIVRPRLSMLCGNILTVIFKLTKVLTIKSLKEFFLLKIRVTDLTKLRLDRERSFLIKRILISILFIKLSDLVDICYKFSLPQFICLKILFLLILPLAGIERKYP